MTIARAFDKFLENRSVYCADKTLQNYREHCGYFFKYLEEKYLNTIAALDYSELPEDDNILAGFIISLRMKGRSGSLSNTSIRTYCRSVKAFLRFCYNEDYCRDYLKNVKLPKEDAAPKIPLRADEVNLLDKACSFTTLLGLRNYCIVHLMLDCGLRSQEVRHLQVEELDAEHNLLRINRSKGAKSRMTLIPDFLISSIRNYLQQCGRDHGYIFLCLRSEMPMTEETIKQLFTDLKYQTGIQRLHAHLLRHTFAVSYLVGGGNLEFLRVFMGHYDYNVTQRYLGMAAEFKMLGSPIYQLDSIFFTRGY